MSLESKNIVIIGGLGGLGLAICQRFLDEGAKNIAIVDILEEKEALSKLPSSKLLYKKCQVENFETLNKALQEINDKFHYVDILINSAGIAHDDDPSKIVSINFTGVVNSSLIALDLISLENGGRGGTVLNLASLAGLLAVGYIPVYSGTKHAILGFTRALSSDFYATSGITFITICPGYTVTPMIMGANRHPTLKRFIPEEVHVKKTQIPQSTSVVAECILQAIKDNENGSVWKCDQGEITKVQVQAPVVS